MAIEGPLKELGLHDVFQLLDLSRKTGVMRVTSQLRDNVGMVAFDRGAIVYAEIRTNPLRIGELLIKAGRITEADLERARAIQQKEVGARRRLGQVLVEMGAISDRELVRHVEFQVAEAVFQLLSWQEGFFSFTEGSLEGVPADAMVSIRTESVLMEGARRIDEWSRIEGHIAHLGVVPGLAPAGHNGDQTRIDLHPAEWEVLALVDGARDVRQIAQDLTRSEFDVARTLFGLASTGVVMLTDPGMRRSLPGTGASAADLLASAEQRLAAGDVAAAREAALAAAALRPGEPRTHVLLARVHLREQHAAEAIEEARVAARLDPRSSDALRWLALALAGAGRFSEAGEQFTRWERLAADEVPATDRDTMRAARAAATLLAQLLGGAHG